jgi:hypothetical protein
MREVQDKRFELLEAQVTLGAAEGTLLKSIVTDALETHAEQVTRTTADIICLSDLPRCRLRGCRVMSQHSLLRPLR